MTDYNFAKRLVSDIGIVSYEEIVLDNNIKIYQYLPYLDYLDENLVDEYNKFILKRRFGFYNDQNNPNQYNGEEKRPINDVEKITNINKYYDELVDLSTKLNNNFYDAIPKVDYLDRNPYFIYQNICSTNLNAEITRLYEIIATYVDLKEDTIEKKYNIKYLFIIVFVIYFIFLLFYNKFN